MRQRDQRADAELDRDRDEVELRRRAVDDDRCQAADGGQEPCCSERKECVRFAADQRIERDADKDAGVGGADLENGMGESGDGLESDDAEGSLSETSGRRGRVPS